MVSVLTAMYTSSWITKRFMMKFDNAVNIRVGFAVVGEYEDPKIQESQGRAFEQMVQWLKVH